MGREETIAEAAQIESQHYPCEYREAEGEGGLPLPGLVLLEGKNGFFWWRHDGVFCGCEGFGGLRVYVFAFCNKSVALAGDRLHKTRLLGIVFQCVTDFADGRVDAVFRINEDVFTPDMLDDLLAGD